MTDAATTKEIKMLKATVAATNPAQAAINAERVKKISTAKTFGKIIKGSVPAEGAPIMRVYGVANGVKSGVSTFGPWSSLTGEFLAVDVQNEKAYIGSQLFGGDILIDMAKAALTDNDEITIAVEVIVKPMDTACGYEYSIKPLITPAASNRLAAVYAALPAPEKVEEKTAEKGAKK